jgi:hypothetical protein
MSHPAVLLKIFIYGYLNRIASSRRLERECQRNVELMWLTGRLAPDFKTIADFRRDSGPAIRKVCSRFIVLCRQLNLFTQAVVAIDGSKFKAVNSRDCNFTPGKIDRRIEQIGQSIQRYLEAVETADRTQPVEAQAKSKRLGEKIERLRERVRQLGQMKEQLQAQDDPQLSTTDPDSRSMTSDGATGIVGYNVQAAVDTKHHLVVWPMRSPTTAATADSWRTWRNKHERQWARRSCKPSPIEATSVGRRSRRARRPASLRMCPSP